MIQKAPGGIGRTTSMADSGLVNLRHLVRKQHHNKKVVLVGFGNYEGSVIASHK